MPIVRGQAGSGRLRPGSKRPSAASRALHGLEPQRQVADAGRLEAVDVELVGALRLEDVDAPVGHDPDAGAGLAAA